MTIIVLILVIVGFGIYNGKSNVTKIIKNDCPETTVLCPTDAMCEIEAKDNQGLGGTFKIRYPCEMRLGYGGA
ncbi:MAG: hypothetical protein AABW71_01985 [Nanoarchaeota archaeon]